MASIKDYLTTAKDVVKGNVSVKGALDAAKKNAKGLLGKQAEASGGYTPAPKSGPSSQQIPASFGAPSSLVSTQKSSGGGGSSSRSSSSKDLLSKAVDDSEDAAEAAKEAALRAAKNQYEETKMAAGHAKESAAGNYQWLIDTIGSNKQDLLTRVATEESTGVAGFTGQETKTKELYDRARQEILSTYRDLSRAQEKVLRGSGGTSSSRSQEATLRLNNLMGKDLSGVSTNEADSLALIGNALQTFKTNIENTRTSIEREAQGKLDKAALDYKTQIDQIDQIIFKSKNDKAAAYAEAEAALAENIASISQWAAGLQMQADEYAANGKASLDGLITSLTDENGALNAGLDEKFALTNQYLADNGYNQILQNPTDTLASGGGVYQKPKSKYKTLAELEDAVARGEVNAAEAQTLRAGLTTALPNTFAMASAPGVPTTKSKDALLSAILA